VQTVYPLSDTEALKLTTAKYYTPSGRCIHKERKRGDDRDRDEDEEAADKSKAKPPEVAAAPNDQKLEKPKNETPHAGDVKPNDAKPSDAKLDKSKSEAPNPDETFRTVGGRTVLGGGGITPDVVIPQSELTQFAIDVERKSYFFNYAIRWVARHPNAKDFKVTPEVLGEFKQMLSDDKFTFEQAAWDANAEYVDIGLRREVARRLHGTKAAYLVSIEGDDQLKKALDLFAHGKTVKDLYAVKAEDLKSLTTADIKQRVGSDGLLRVVR
jgi:carboxyl-terminal processing protease